MIHKVSIGIEKTKAVISIPHYDPVYGHGLTHMVFTFYGDALKSRIFRKLLSIEGILINEATIYFFDYDLKIQENMLDILKLLASINITENNKLRKITEEFLDGTIEFAKFEEEVVAYCVAGKLSE